MTATDPSIPPIADAQPAQPCPDPSASSERGNPRAFAMAFLITFAVVLLPLYGVNFYANQNGVFPSTHTPSLADRAWKTRRVQEAIRRKRAPEVLVMGSSRMMQVQPPYVEAITGKRTFNYGCTAAGPTDYLTQLRFVLANGHRPKMLIVGLDDFAFSRGAMSRFQLQAAAHPGLLMQAPLRERIAIISGALNTITADATWNGAAELIRRRGAPAGAAARRKVFRRSRTIMLADGYLIYEQKAREEQEGTFDLERGLRFTAGRWKARLETGQFSLADLEPARRPVEVFDQFLDLAHQNHIEVKVLVLPLHPLYEREAFTPDLMAVRDRTSAVIADLCTRHGATYRDFRRLESFGGDPNLFWDGAHQRPENVRRMINALFGKPPDEVVVKLPTDLEIVRKPPKITSLTTD